jgi:hypothetical protein
MDDRPTDRTRSRSLTMGPIALLLAALLLSGGGPGLAATAGRSPAQTPARGISSQILADPIGDLAFALDYDPDSIFRFVADEIAYEPYTGILRGASGTLEARAGNSVDKALLLGALLDASLIPYRFARGRLDDVTSARLLDSLPADADTARRLATRPLDAGVEQTARNAPAPDPAASGPVAGLDLKQDAELKAEGQARLQEATSRLDDTVTMLEAALAGAGVELPAQDISLPPDEVTGHTWVQAEFGPEWRDLDATLPAAEPGSVLTAASETLDRLPDDLRYRIGFDVLVERVEGGRLVTDSVLDHEEYADSLSGVPVTFGHVTPSGLQTLGLTLSSLFGAGWIDYRPTLDLGGEAIVADEAVAFPSGGGDSDIFSTDPSPAPRGGAPIEGEATAEWLEVSVTPPGGERAVARRTVFDSVPRERRAVGTPTIDDVAPITLVDLEGTGSVGYPPMEGVEAFAIATGPTSVAPLVAASDDGMGMLALAYHNLRDVMSESMVLDAGARTYLDGPNVVSVSVRVDPNATAGDLAGAARFGLDIWHRSHGMLPLTGGTISVGDAQIMAGVTDHLAERFAMEFAGDTPLVTNGTMGVGELFEAAAAQGIPTVVLHGDAPDALPYDPQATATIRQLVGAGEVVVVPAEPVAMGDAMRVGWWAIDPATGETTDTMDDGSASEFGEYGLVVRTRIGLVRCYGALAGVVVGYLAAATSALSVMNIMSSFAPGEGAAATCLAL